MYALGHRDSELKLKSSALISLAPLTRLPQHLGKTCLSASEHSGRKTYVCMYGTLVIFKHGLRWQARGQKGRVATKKATRSPRRQAARQPNAEVRAEEVPLVGLRSQHKLGPGQCILLLCLSAEGMADALSGLLRSRHAAYLGL